ncbi:TetR/AcrR family transcriptional regulator [Amycolatopsis palatopharyngis]|uniref:TetR/AcrR family transcriptional regulator n=1 Tax=Amycolatopsis palatopharyngis TaxID=187982 RepID=UPI000E263090|nr:TetR family transcriptional regulator [Amycolatopsis palatopharyngis]
MSPADQPATAKRRGRRPAGEDTRTALLDAARSVFAESGYEGATVRVIATRAGVDAAMVNHWFGGKEGLFAKAVLQLPFDPKDIVAALLDGDVDSLGQRIVRTFLTNWDGAGRDGFVAVVRSVTGHDEALKLLKDTLVKYIFSGLASAVSANDREFRAALCATQVVGIGMVRYVIKLEPFASADIDTVTAAVAPTLQRYLTGDLS